MGYFTIKLPNNKKGDVRFGPVKKMKTLSHRFRRKDFDKEEMGFIVKVDTGYVNEYVYYLLKTKEGQWLDIIQNQSTALIKDCLDKMVLQKD